MVPQIITAVDANDPDQTFSSVERVDSERGCRHRGEFLDLSQASAVVQVQEQPSLQFVYLLIQCNCQLNACRIMYMDYTI